jgi:hypothetical protein
MSETITTVVSSSIGIIGVILGILLTKMIERNDKNRNEKKIVKAELIWKMDIMQNGINSIAFVICIMKDFISYDFNKFDDQKQTIEVITKLAGLNLENNRTSWGNIYKDVYLYLPKTVQCKYFNEFERFIINIFKSINVIDRNIDGMDELQRNIIMEYKYGLVCSPYVIMIMQMEFRSIISGVKVFYSDEEKKLRTGIEKFIKDKY